MINLDLHEKFPQRELMYSDIKKKSLIGLTKIMTVIIPRQKVPKVGLGNVI